MTSPQERSNIIRFQLEVLGYARLAETAIAHGIHDLAAIDGEIEASGA